MASVEDELQDATGSEPREGEDRQAYLRRLTKAISNLAEPVWEKLSNAAQTWYNTAVEQSVITDFEGVLIRPKTNKPGPKLLESEKGVETRIKRLCLQHPDWTAAQVIEALAAAGDKCSKITVTNVRRGFRHTLRFLEVECGVTDIRLKRKYR